MIIPLIAGVSSSTEELCRRRNPSPRTVARCDTLVPMRLLTSVTFTVFSAIIHPMISSIDFPRFAATSAGVVIELKPLIVARTML